MEKKFGKLVRDNVPAIIEAKGQKPVTRVLGNGEYLVELIAKLREETEEFAADQSPEELADITEVVLAIRDAIGISPSELEEIRQNKASRNGTFEDRMYLEGVE